MDDDYRIITKGDLKALTSEMQEHDSLLRLKRRWLMDLPLSNNEQKRLEELLPPNDKILPESLLREDDVSYKDIKTCVEIGFGSERVISTPSETYYDAAVKVLDGLKDFPTNILKVMHRKLRGKKGYRPAMREQKSGRARSTIIRVLRKRCTKMLLRLRKTGEPEERLSNVLGVAGLALKLLFKRPVSVEFRIFLPGIEALHTDIAKAIWLLKDAKRVSFIELKKVQLLHDPDIEISARSLRSSIRHLLTGYLFECSDMDVIPDRLIETLDIINRRSRSPHDRKQFASKIILSPQELLEEIQNEVEYVLNVSAQAKEVVLESNYGHEFDEDFENAYMDIFGESDTHFISDEDNDQLGESEFHSPSLTESFGEIDHSEVNSPVSPSERDGSAPLLSPMQRLNVHSPSSHESELLDGQSIGRKSNPVKVKAEPNLTSPSHSHNKSLSQDDSKEEETVSCPIKVEFSDIPVERKHRVRNQYLEVQEACDATSKVAYRFVGHMLDELAKIEGLELEEVDRLYLRSSEPVLEDSEEMSDTLLTSKFSGIWQNVLNQ